MYCRAINCIVQLNHMVWTIDGLITELYDEIGLGDWRHNGKLTDSQSKAMLVNMLQLIAASRNVAFRIF